MALEKLQFPAGLGSFTDANNNAYYPDVNGQLSIDPTLVDVTIFLNAGFTAVVDSGSATRPPITEVGQHYFDTTLGTVGKPIWVNSTKSGWVDATGTAV
jgi:hypothetical protein